MSLSFKFSFSVTAADYGMFIISMQPFVIKNCPTGVVFMQVHFFKLDTSKQICVSFLTLLVEDYALIFRPNQAHVAWRSDREILCVCMEKKPKNGNIFFHSDHNQDPIGIQKVYHALPTFLPSDIRFSRHLFIASVIAFLDCSLFQ